MARSKDRTEFVGIVAREISSGIDRALTYWLGRIEVEVIDSNLTSAQRVLAVERILREYKQLNGRDLECASA